MKRKFLGSRGFTLIELLIVVAIIAILTVVFLPTLRGGQISARDAARKANVNNIVIGIEKILNGDTALPATVPDGNVGICLDFAAGVGANIRTALSKSIGATPDNVKLCDGGFFYRSFRKDGTPGADAVGNLQTNYVVITQVEKIENGNVSGGALAVDTAANALAAVQGAFNAWASTLTRATGAATNAMWAATK